MPVFNGVKGLAGSGGGTLQRKSLLEELSARYLPEVVEDVRRLVNGMLDLNEGGASRIPSTPQISSKNISNQEGIGIPANPGRVFVLSYDSDTMSVYWHAVLLNGKITIPLLEDKEEAYKLSRLLGTIGQTPEVEELDIVTLIDLQKRKRRSINFILLAKDCLANGDADKFVAPPVRLNENNSTYKAHGLARSIKRFFKDFLVVLGALVLGFLVSSIIGSSLPFSGVTIYSCIWLVKRTLWNEDQ